jgi:hypothetical protein
MQLRTDLIAATAEVSGDERVVEDESLVEVPQEDRVAWVREQLRVEWHHLRR